MPTFDQINGFVAHAETAINVFTAKGSTLTDDVKAALPLAGNILDVFAPGLSIAGFSPSKIIATVVDLASASDGPATPLTDAFSELKAAVAGGPAPTAAAWKVFDERADKAHADWKAALAAA
jgi:hypothetical protein